MIEEISRAELGLPPRDSNIELVDMDVSSGASSSSSVTSAESSARSVVDVNNIEEQTVERSPASPPPPPPLPSSMPITLEESQSSPVLWPTTPSLIHQPKTFSKLTISNNSQRNEEKFVYLSKSSPRHAFVSRSPSIISDDVMFIKV